MRVHSRLRLVTNSSSETFSFSGLGRTQAAIDEIIENLWVEFCIDPVNEESLREWWRNEACYAAGRRPYRNDPFSRSALLNFGSPVQFTLCRDGAAEFYTSMNNDTAVDQFCAFVQTRLNASPVISGTQREVCRECMARGLNTCPPCRL